MILISIITINLNNKNGLQRTIESVIRQNYDKYELIIIDGGSTDDSVKIIQQFSHKIAFWESEIDNGIYQAMNKGIKESNGEYCFFLNSGDVFCNDNVLTDTMNQNLVADIITGNAFVNDKDNKMHLVKAPERISFYTFFQHTILHQATLIRTSIFKEIGFYNENLKIVADWEFFIKALFLHQSSYQSININISVFDSTGISSQTENSLISLMERENVLQKYFPNFITDYQLLQPRSTFVFLQNIRKNLILRKIFIFTSRLLNKLFTILCR
jgi:glycosyltransferase involved in cell wall biosynthesis